MIMGVTTNQTIPGSAEQRATRIVFFIAGFGYAAWAPLVPFAKARAGISDGGLGLLLLCLGAGSIVMMPLAGALSAKLGCRRVIIASAVFVAASLPFLTVVSSAPLLVAALLVFGASVGTIDVSMNIQAIIVERASGRSMMSGFHGLFSVGGIAGAGGMTALLSLGISPFASTLCISVCILAALAIAQAHLLSYGSRNEGPAFAIPHGVVLFIGMLCFVLFLAEGAILDWSAVFLTSDRHMDATYAGLGYAAFATTMTIGRLFGDRIVHRLGSRKIILAGGLFGAAGFAVATLVASPVVAILGYALVGVGCSNIVPVLFTAVGRQTVMPENVAVPAITTLGYVGILAGPAGIGFIAHASSLSVAFLIMALMLLGVAFSGRFLRT
ncbi:MAG: MFS transporter [Janthinobacterium lividum]